VTRKGLVIEADRCIGCWVCVTACKDEFVLNDILPYSKGQPDTQYGYYPGFPQPGVPTGTGKVWVQHGQNWIDDGEVVVGQYPKVKAQFLPLPCMHCADPPCMKVSSGGAVYKRNDGIVIIDPANSVGQKQIVSACPYGRVYWNSDLNIPQKCTLCAHLVDQGKNPKCVDACPIHAIHFGDLDDPNSDASKVAAARNAEPYHPEYGTQPTILYAGLLKPFLSGKVVDGRTGEYLTGATVVLTGTDGQSHTAITDNYADFEFPGLKVRQMYNLRIKKDGYFDKVMLVFLDRAKDIGKLQLFPEGV